jgi:hypothetical protein
MNEGRKRELRQKARALWKEEDRILDAYDCGRALAEHIGPPRLREIRLELEAMDEECRLARLTEEAVL